VGGVSPVATADARSMVEAACTPLVCTGERFVAETPYLFRGRRVGKRMAHDAMLLGCGRERLDLLAMDCTIRAKHVVPQIEKPEAALPESRGVG
jgi:hypothetical protein